MKRTAACIIAVALIFLLAGCAALEEAAALQEYELGEDSIITINALVGTRSVTGVSTSQSGGSITKEYTYKSDSVREDLTAYLTELVNNQGYLAIEEDIDLAVVPGSAKIAIVSPSDTSKIIIMEILYTGTEYTIGITRMTGTLNTY